MCIRDRTRIGPIEQPDAHARIVIEPARQIGLVQAEGGEGAGDLATADGEAQLRRAFRRFQPGGRGEVDAVEGQLAIVIGKAEHESVTARQAPAMAKRGRSRRDMGGETGWNVAHGQTSGNDLDHGDARDLAGREGGEIDLDRIGIEADRHVEGEASGHDGGRRRDRAGGEGDPPGRQVAGKGTASELDAIHGDPDLSLIHI